MVHIIGRWNGAERVSLLASPTKASRGPATAIQLASATIANRGVFFVLILATRLATAKIRWRSMHRTLLVLGFSWTMMLVPCPSIAYPKPCHLSTSLKPLLLSLSTLDSGCGTSLPSVSISFSCSVFCVFFITLRTCE